LQMEPRILLLDEPLAGLDVASANTCSAILAMLKRESRVTILLVEHRHEHLLSIADHVFSLAEGVLRPMDQEQVQPTAEILPVYEP